MGAFTESLRGKGDNVVAVYACVTAYIAYTCIYFIRTGLFVNEFEGITVFGSMDLKTAYAMAQTAGYGLGKIPSVLYASNIAQQNLLLTLHIACVLATLCMCLCQIITSNEVRVFLVFAAGICLTPIYGMLVRYLEGRKASGAIISIFSLSWITSSSITKSVGQVLLNKRIGSYEMNTIVSLAGLVGFVAFSVLLAQVPPPSARDTQAKGVRRAVKAGEQSAFIRRFFPGLLLITIAYMTLAMIRAFRDYFNPEIWSELLHEEYVNPNVYTSTEIPVGVVTLCCMSLFTLIKNNFTAFRGMLGVMIIGMGCVFASTVMFDLGWLSPQVWQIIFGSGLFAAYIPPGSMMFDRLMAVTGVSVTSTFLIYIMDGSGYVCTIGLLLYKNYGGMKGGYVSFIETCAYIGAIIVCSCVISAILYFQCKLQNGKDFSSLPTSLNGEDEIDGNEGDERLLLEDDENV